MSLLKWIIVVPIAVLLVVFAIANRQVVTVAFDPFNRDDPSVALAGPLFLVLFVTAGLGVLAGGIATWIGAVATRRAARQARAEAGRLRIENERLRLELHAREPDDIAGFPKVAALTRS